MALVLEAIAEGNLADLLVRRCQQPFPEGKQTCIKQILSERHAVSGKQLVQMTRRYTENFPPGNVQISCRSPWNWSRLQSPFQTCLQSVAQLKSY